MSKLRIIYGKLREVARNRDTISYEDVGNLVGLQMEDPAHRNELVGLLDQISRHEHRAGRPMLSAVVVHKDTRIPGQGFFKLARELGRYSGSDDLFHVRELKAVHDVHARGRAGRDESRT